MKKQFPAFIAAIIVTSVIALAMMITSVNALTNKNGTVVSNDPARNSSTTSNINQAQIDQLLARISEFQQREAKYQQLLQDSQQQLQQANAQNQQYRQFVFSMQQAGLIQIRTDGTVIITGQPGNN